MQLQPRSAAEVGKDFPYEMSTVCYIEIHKDGRVTHGTDQGTYPRAKNGESTLYAVWPGAYSSHLFVIDDLDQYAGALGIIHDEERTGLAEHDHEVNWQVSPYEQNPTGTYVSVEVTLLCGCKINNIRAFAEQMRKQKGWNVTTSTGWSGGGAIGGPRTYTVGVRRRSLDG